MRIWKEGEGSSHERKIHDLFFGWGVVKSVTPDLVRRIIQGELTDKEKWALEE